MKVNWNNKPAKGTDLRFNCGEWGVKSEIEDWWTTAAFIPPRISALRKAGKELTTGRCGDFCFTANTKLGSPRHETPFLDTGNIAQRNNLPLFRELIVSTCVGYVAKWSDNSWARETELAKRAPAYSEFELTDSVVVRYGAWGRMTAWVEIAEKGSDSKVFDVKEVHPANDSYAEHLRSFIEWAKAGDPQGIIDWSRLEAAIAPPPTPEPKPLVLASWCVKYGVVGEIEDVSHRTQLGWSGASFPLSDGTFLFVAPVTGYYVYHVNKSQSRVAKSEPVDYYAAALAVWQNTSTGLGGKRELFPEYVH